MNVPPCTCPKWGKDPACRLDAYLKAKEAAAADAFFEGRISIGQMFRHEMDTGLHQNSGPITFRNAIAQKERADV